MPTGWYFDEDYPLEWDEGSPLHRNRVDKPSKSGAMPVIPRSGRRKPRSMDRGPIL